ncbi:MAG: hypothetical protein AAGE94_05555 [Acidobacteriota bacterium]
MTPQTSPLSRPRSARRLVIATMFLVGALLALPTAASETAGGARALGLDGTFYQVLDGTRSQLLGEGEGELRVLALEVTPAGGESERILVPGTETWRRESHAQVFVDGDTVLMVWRQGAPGGRFSLHFQSWRDGEWLPGSQIQVGHANHLFDSDPTLLLTREAYSLDLDDETTIEVRRTIVHVVWQAESGEVRYVGIPFVDGRYIGWHEPLALTGILVKSNTGHGAGSAASPTIVACRVLDGTATVSITLDDPQHNRLATIHVETLPMELAVVGDAIRDEITGLGTDFDPNRIPEIRDKMLGRAVWIGHRLRLSPAVLDFLTSRLGEWISGLDTSSVDDSDALADAARHEAIELGREVYAKGVVDPDDLSAGIPDLDLTGDPDSNGHRDALGDLVRFDLRSDFVSPEVGPGAVTVHASDDGRALLVSWHDTEAGRIEWAENRGAGWSDPRVLTLSDALDIDSAHALLRESIR